MAWCASNLERGRKTANQQAWIHYIEKKVREHEAEQAKTATKGTAAASGGREPSPTMATADAHLLSRLHAAEVNGLENKCRIDKLEAQLGDLIKVLGQLSQQKH